MLVREMMKEPVRIQSAETFVAAARKLKHDNGGALPVCQDMCDIAMITDRDIAMRGLADDWRVGQMTAWEVMSAQITFCFEDDSVE
jgi:predicted transcriptional regulator